MISPESGRIDRTIKVRGYAAVLSIRQYVIVESSSAARMVFERTSPGGAGATTLTRDDILKMPGIGIEIPAAGLYEDIPFVEDDGSPA